MRGKYIIIFLMALSVGAAIGSISFYRIGYDRGLHEASLTSAVIKASINLLLLQECEKLKMNKKCMNRLIRNSQGQLDESILEIDAFKSASNYESKLSALMSKIKKYKERNPYLEGNIADKRISEILEQYK